MENLNAKELKDVVIRFSGDSGDGMQMTGTLFSNTSALIGNGISTFPDYPAEIRAPQGTVAGVSGFQVHIGAGKVTNPGDYCDALVAMNPAALKANRKWLKKDATVIIDGDTLTEENIKKAWLGGLQCGYTYNYHYDQSGVGRYGAGQQVGGKVQEYVCIGNLLLHLQYARGLRKALPKR